MAAASLALESGGWTHRVLSFSAAVAAGLTALAFFTVRPRFHDPDAWWHLRVGQMVVEDRAVPRTDSFSYTTGNHPWLPHEWLSQASMYAAYKVGGYRGLWSWMWVLASAIFAGTYLLCQVYSGSPRIAFLGGMLAWFFGTVNLAPRPLLVGHLLLVAELLVLVRARERDPRWLWALPPLFALWVNCHGSYFLGFGVLVVFVFASFLRFQAGAITASPAEPAFGRRLGLAAALCAAALLANPAGWKLLAYPIDVFTNQGAGLAAVAEWRPLDVTDPRGLGLCAVAGLLVLLLLTRRVTVRPEELLLLVMAFGMALRHVRLAFVFGILAAPVLCRLLAELDGPQESANNRAASLLLILAAAAAMVMGFPSDEFLRKQVVSQNPAGAVEFIKRTNLRGRMLNEYDWGGYLIWTLPEQKVFIDGRADVFDWTGVLGEFGRWATLQEDPQILLKKYRIDYCLIRKRSPVAFVLPYLPGWRQVYQDEIASIFAREELLGRPAS